MATRYNANVFAAKMPVDALVLRAHRVLETHGLAVDQNPAVWVDDQDAEHEIPEYIAKGVEDAARYLMQWPHTGAMGYLLRHRPNDPESTSTGYVVRVFYSSNSELSVLGLAFIGDAFKPDRFPDTLPVITTLVEAFHEEFAAYRSGFDWGLNDDVSEDDEVLALSSGRVEPRPGQWLDIIHGALVTPELLEQYRAAMKAGSVLRRTASDSLFWQRDAGPP
jgi:hypothetical protein